MPEMSVAGIADGFDPFQKCRPVKAICDCIDDHRLGKRRPPGAGLEFLRRIEEDGFAAEAGIDPRLKQPAHLRTEGALSARFTSHVIFLRAQLPAPLSVRLDDLAVRGGIAILGEIEDVGPFQHLLVSYRGGRLGTPRPLIHQRSASRKGRDVIRFPPNTNDFNRYWEI